MNKFLFGKSDRKVHFIAKLGIMLALTLAMQFLSGFLGQQLITGSVVNLFLILSALTCGLVGGVIIGLITPIIGFVLGLSGNILLTPFIGVANAIYIVAFLLILKALKFDFSKDVSKFLDIVKGALSFIVGAVLKFLFMYFIALKLILPLVFGGAVPPPVVIAFGITQLFTALIGGVVAFVIAFALEKTNLI